jgi:aminoglycoside phosphotransferase (APT) family kinase protein
VDELEDLARTAFGLDVLTRLPVTESFSSTVHVPQSDEPCLVHFDLRPGNVLVRDGRLVGIIDFESCRGGHASMDFFKLWQQVEPERLRRRVPRREPAADHGRRRPAGVTGRGWTATLRRCASGS